jgi:hypothetical protein
LLSILLLGIHATAKELVWNVPKPPDGSQSTASYISDAGNWTPSGVPSDGDVLVFSDADLKSAATFDSPEVDFSGLIFNRWQRIEGQRLPGISAGSWTFNHSGGSSISPACNIERQDAVIRTSDYYTGVIFLGGLCFGEEGRTVTFSGEGLTDVHGFYGPHSATSRIVKNGEGILRIRASSSANSPEILVQGGRLAIDQKNPPVGQRVEIGTGGTLTGLGWIGLCIAPVKLLPAGSKVLSVESRPHSPVHSSLTGTSALRRKARPWWNWISFPMDGTIGSCRTERAISAGRISSWSLPTATKCRWVGPRRWWRCRLVVKRWCHSGTRARVGKSSLAGRFLS